MPSPACRIWKIIKPRGETSESEEEAVLNSHRRTCERCRKHDKVSLKKIEGWMKDSGKAP